MHNVYFFGSTTKVGSGPSKTFENLDIHLLTTRSRVFIVVDAVYDRIGDVRMENKSVFGSLLLCFFSGLFVNLTLASFMGNEFIELGGTKASVHNNRYFTKYCGTDSTTAGALSSRAEEQRYTS